MTYDADENFTPDKVFILKGEEISEFGLAKQEQLLDLMAEASQLYPDASAEQVIEFAKQRLLTKNVLSNYQEITAPPLPSLLELTSGVTTDEVAEEEATDELFEESPSETDELPVDGPAADEPVADEGETWYAPEAEEGAEDVPEAAEEPSDEPVDEIDTDGGVEAYEPAESLPEEADEEPEYTLEEEVEEYVVEDPAGTDLGYSEGANTGADSAEEESPQEEVQAVEPAEKLVTSYDQANPATFRQERRYVGLLEAAARMDAKGD